MPSDELILELHGTPLGTLTRGASPPFVKIEWVADATAHPVALTANRRVLPGLPTTSEAISHFVGGYTPEGTARLHLATNKNISAEDLFGFLAAYGASLAGAVTFRDPLEPPTFTPHYDPITDANLSAELERAVREHDLHVRDDSQSMLPGFQPKLLVAQFENTWTAPHGRAHSTHILKPLLRTRPEAIPAEYYSHQLTRATGLSSFGSELLKVEGTRFLAIERFDRRVTGHRVTLLHQEDLAQAIGLDWRYDFVKFDRDPGRNWRRLDLSRASARAIATVIDETAGPDAVAQWLRQLSYHVAIGNNDAHAKNVTLLHRADGTRLADVYDAIPNLYQGDRTNFQVALAIAGETDHRRLTLGHLVSEAVEWSTGLREPRAETLVRDTLAAVLAAVDAIEPPAGVDPRMRPRIVSTVERLLAGDEIGATA